MNKMELLLNYLQSHRMIIFVVAVIVFDLFLGVMRAFKERKTNSTIGIDGMIRKASTLGCLVFLICMDFLVKINFIGWVPDQILVIFKTLGIEAVGVSDVFGLLFVIFELMSVLKNWALLGLPMFKGINEWISNFLETFTDEMPTTNKNQGEK